MNYIRRFIVALITFCILLFAVVPFTSYAANVGILKGNLWYSHYPFYTGETVTIYTAVWNGETEKVFGHISYTINSKEIGNVPFTVNAGELRDVSTKWVAVSGSSRINASIKDAYKIVNGAQISVLAENPVAGEETVQVTNDPVKELAAAKAALESASKSSPTSSNSSGSNTVVYVGTPLASAINPVTENLPKGIEDVAKTGAGFIDSFSSNTAARLGASKASLKNTLDAAARLSVAEEKLAQTSGSATSTKASGFGALTKYLKDQMAATGGLKEPWTYAKYLGITMLLYLVSRPIVLAIILTLVLLYIIWKIIRHFRRHRLD